MHVGEAALVAAVDVRDVQLRRRFVDADGVESFRERLVVAERADAARALGHLLDARARHRDAEEVHLAADAGGEVEKPAIRRPLRRPGIEIPRRRQVDWLAAAQRADPDVLRPAVRQPLLDDHVGAERSRVREVLAVGRVSDITIDEAVVGQARHLAVDADRPQIGGVVLQLVAPLGIRGERDRLAVRMPGEVGRAEIHVDEDLRRRLRAGRPRPDDNLLRRQRHWIRRRKLGAIALEILPVEGDALESLLVPFLELRRVDRRRRISSLADGRRLPLAIRARCRRDTAAASTTSAATNRRAGRRHWDTSRRVRIDLPSLAAGGVPAAIRPRTTTGS